MRMIQLGSLSGLALVTVLAGCAGNGTNLLTTATVPKPQAKAVVDPRCVALLAQIEQLKADGTVGRVEKAADGKTSSVRVKRAALGKVAELNQAYAAYQTECSKPGLIKKPAAPAKTAATEKAGAAQKAPVKQAQGEIKKAPAAVASALKPN